MIEEFGHYESSFFIMSVPTEEDIEPLYMSDVDFAVFFHEYIHFLQDITSFYGYMGIYSHGEYLRRVINDLYGMPKEINVPVDIENKRDFVKLNKDIAVFSLGDIGDFDWVIIKEVFIENFQLTDNCSIPELHVKAVTNRGSEEIIVGAYAIRENMAYLLERMCTTKYRTSRDFPYQIVEQLANYFCPGMLSELELLALCDISLQCSVPGHGLYMMLKAFSEGRLIVNKAEDIYDFFFSKKTRFLGEEMEMKKALLVASAMAIDHLLSYVQIDVLSEEYQEWINFTLNAGVGMRICQPYFFLNMAKGKKDKGNAVLKYIAKNIGSPEMINLVGKRFQLTTDRPACRFEYLEAVKDIEQLFENGVKKCSLKALCNMSPDGPLVDERCEREPWKRCMDANLCPYGLLWRHWNLADKVIV